MSAFGEQMEPFDAGAVLGRHLARQVTDKLAPTNSNSATTLRPPGSATGKAGERPKPEQPHSNKFEKGTFLTR